MKKYLAFSLLIYFVGCSPAAPEVEVVKGAVAEAHTTPWVGFGYNQDPLDRDATGNDVPTWDPVKWTLTKERISFIRPSLVRINLNRVWFNPSGIVGQYDWESPIMQSFYSVLDFYLQNNIPVMTGLWQSTLSRDDTTPFYVTTGAESFQQLQVDLFNQLFTIKKFTNLKWYTPTNEPKGTGMDFTAWQAMMHNTYLGFENASLPITRFCGADSWEEWNYYAALYNKNDLSGYDHHYYLNTGFVEVTHGSFESYLKQNLASIQGADNDNKPVFLSESGFSSTTAEGVDYWYTQQPAPAVNPGTYFYGLLAFDYGIQVARSGESGALAWSLDGYDYGKDPGMWNISGNNGGSKLRPWYYSWSLLCRYFPANGIVSPINFSSTLVRGVALQQMNGSNAHFTFAFVNQSDKEVTIAVVFPQWSGGTFSKYVYSESTTMDGNSLELPIVYFGVASLNSGFSLKVPAQSGVLLTTMNQQPIGRL